MSYFGFLAAFILIPIFVLVAIILFKLRSGKSTSASRNISKVRLALGIHIVLALLYTTPWDNYLVATRVWYYNPGLVSGIVLGFVPLEEYIFFILETLLTGLWWRVLAGRIHASQDLKSSGSLRLGSVIVVTLIWLGAALVFLNHPGHYTYLSILLFWALPAMIPQLAFGSDILWQQRRLLAWTILPMGLYLSLTDALAITSGTWTIDRAQSSGIFIGRLPVEEGVFFFVTVLLVSFGMTLLTAEESRSRWVEIKETFKRFTAQRSP